MEILLIVLLALAGVCAVIAMVRGSIFSGLGLLLVVLSSLLVLLVK